VRFLALGDSYTIGEGVEPADRWPSHLVGMLRQRGNAIDDPVIVARTAWTTDELMDAIDEANPVGPFDIVSLMIGVNDQYRSRPIEQFEASFVPLLDQAIGFARGGASQVIVLSIPDWGATPFAEGRDRALIGREIDAYNASGRALVERRGARWHDVTPISRRVSDDPALVVDDKLHPSGEMYRQWALSLVEPFEALLRSAGSASARA
jgi:lysophospholipase L1-like esterase